MPEIIQEMLLATSSERQGRMIDHDEAGFNGKRKAGGLLLIISQPLFKKERQSSPFYKGETGGLKKPISKEFVEL